MEGGGGVRAITILSCSTPLPQRYARAHADRRRTRSQRTTRHTYQYTPSYTPTLQYDTRHIYETPTALNLTDRQILLHRHRPGSCLFLRGLMSAEVGLLRLKVEYRGLRVGLGRAVHEFVRERSCRRGRYGAAVFACDKPWLGTCKHVAWSNGVVCVRGGELCVLINRRQARVIAARRAHHPLAMHGRLQWPRRREHRHRVMEGFWSGAGEWSRDSSIESGRVR